MAEPARKFEDDKKPGNADSAPPGRAELEVLEGGGETSAPNRSWYKGDKKTVDKDELSDIEDKGGEAGQTQGPQHENQVGSGYRSSNKLSRQEKRAARRWMFTKRRAALGGGIVGTIVAVFGFFFFQGPLQFIHIAQLMEQFHFSAQEDQADDRFIKLARYIRYSTKGEAEKTRLGIFQNKIADNIEAKMNETGIKSSYSDVFGFGDGYVIDPDKLSSTEFEDLKGKSPEEIQKYFKDNFNVDIKTKLPNGTDVPRGSFFVDSTNLGYFENRKLLKVMLLSAKYSKVSSSVGARIMGERAGVTWHPIKKLDNKILKTVEARYKEWKKNQVSDIENGAATELDARSTPADPEHPENANEAAGEGNATASDGRDVNTKVGDGDTSAISAFQDRLSVKVGLGSASAAGILCMAKGLGQNVDQIKQKQVVLPLIRMGIQYLALGHQIMDNSSDLSTEQLGFYSKQLNGKDSRGHNTSWIQAQSIQAELGHKVSGDVGKPDDTLTTIGKGSPFDFLAQGTLGTILQPVCSAPGQIATTIVSFFGGPISALTQTVVSSVASGPIMNTIAHWLSGNAVDPLPVGADLGNDINFGNFLAANAQGVSRGGRELTKSETNKLAAAEAQYSHQEFQSHSLAYKLLNPFDERTAISKVIDNTSTSPTQNIAKMGSFFLNFGQIFASVSKLLTPNAHAAAGSYDYGIPQTGFSKEEMNNPAVKNPYLNACYVVGCQGVKDQNGNTINITGILQKPGAGGYIDRASKCFGVTIDVDTHDIDSYQDGNPEYKDIGSSDCTAVPPSDCTNNTSDACNWLRVRFYIFDTENMESIACYEGEDEACSDVSFEEAQSSQASANPTQAPSGNAQQLAQQILNNNSISLSCYSASVQQDVQNAAAGKPGTAGAPISSAILQLIATVGQDHNVCITAIESGGQGHTDGSLHYSGDAVDFGNLDGAALTGRDSASDKIIETAFNVLPTGSGIGQSQCGDTPNLPGGWTTFEDTCNHLHIQVARGTP